MSAVADLREPRDTWLSEVLGVVSSRFGQVVPERRMAAFRRAVIEAYVASGAPSLDEYRARVSMDALDSPFVAELLSRLTVKESYFFRDESAMSALRELVLPKLVARNAASKRLSVWSAGCSNGEEPYSLAILIDQVLSDAPGWTVRVVGTDVDDTALRFAVRAEYGEWSVRGVAPAVRERYFESCGAKLRLRDRYRRWVRFEPHNLADAASPLPEPASFDVVLCRNVGIYLSDEAARVLYGKLVRALAPGGVLITAPSDPRPADDSGLSPVLLRTRSHTTLAHTERPSVWEAPSRVSRCPELRSTIPAAPTGRVETSIPPPPPVPVEAAAEPEPRRAEAALALAAAGDVEGAVRALEQAIAAGPLDPAPYFALALVEIDRHRHAAAEAALRKALYVAPEFAEADYRLGLLCARRGDLVGGRRSLLNALRITRAAGESAPSWAAAIGAQLATLERRGR